MKCFFRMGYDQKCDMADMGKMYLNMLGICLIFDGSCRRCDSKTTVRIIKLRPQPSDVVQKRGELSDRSINHSPWGPELPVSPIQWPSRGGFYYKNPTGKWTKPIFMLTDPSFL